MFVVHPTLSEDEMRWMAKVAGEVVDEATE